MKKLSQNKRIVIGIIGITLMTILAVVYFSIRYEIGIDLIVPILLLGFGDGLMICRWTSWWTASDNKKS